ncbi:MAG: RluA family pseudouridine synthase [Betaproteobacteria bacterium]|nr:RluA family pseudouridine synthase [Betaproteobacteria bacterium]
MSDLEFEDEDYSPSDSTLPRRESLRVSAEEAGLRLDQVLARRLPDVSRTRLAEIAKAGGVSVEGRSAAPKLRLAGFELIELELPPRDEDLAFSPEPIDLAIIHADADVLVIDKPPGLVVHPAAGNWRGTLLNGLLHFDAALARVPRAGIVHRLDKDTSGLMVVARNETAQTHLVRQLQARTVSREYVAIAQGHLNAPLRVDAPIGRHPRQRTRMAVVSEAKGGKAAATRVSPIEALAEHTLIACLLETGRTHQIRVHLQSLGHPLEGDATYGAKPWRKYPAWTAAVQAFGRQALHARRLAFVHPQSGATLEFESQLPDDFTRLLAILRGAPQ